MHELISCTVWLCSFITCTLKVAGMLNSFALYFSLPSPLNHLLSNAAFSLHVSLFRRSASAGRLLKSTAIEMRQEVTSGP